MTSKKLLLMTGAVAAAAWLGSVPAMAQNASMQDLLNRVDRLQRELSTLERAVYTGKTPPPASAAGAAASSSDEPGAANSTAARNSIRITDVETQLQTLTGRIEDIGHQVDLLDQQVKSLSADIQQRLAAGQGGGNAGAGGQQTAAPNVQLPLQQGQGQSMGGQGGQSAAAGTQGQGQGVAAPSAPARSAPGQMLGAPARPLGTIPRNMAIPVPQGTGGTSASGAPGNQTGNQAGQQPQQQAAAPGALPAGTPEQQYQYALSLMLQKQDFATAEKALKAFIKAHPRNKLAGNAYYWLGETYYVRQRYQDAAFTFAEGFQKHSRGNKAPDSLLKLGMSLDHLGKEHEACTAYSRLLDNFPHLNARLKARVQHEQNVSNCH